MFRCSFVVLSLFSSCIPSRRVRVEQISPPVKIFLSKNNRKSLPLNPRARSVNNPMSLDVPALFTESDSSGFCGVRQVRGTSFVYRATSSFQRLKNGHLADIVPTSSF